MVSLNEEPQRRTSISGPFRLPGQRIKYCHWLLILACGIIGVTVSGVLTIKGDLATAFRYPFKVENKNDVYTEAFNRNAASNMDAVAELTLSNFDPSSGLTYQLQFVSSLNSKEPNATLSIPFACYFSDNLNNRHRVTPSFSTQSTRDSRGAVVNAGTHNATAGSSFQYPFDTYTIQITLSVVAITLTDPTVQTSCDANLVNIFKANPIPFQAAVTQHLDGFSASFNLAQVSDVTGVDNPNNYILTLIIKRDGIIKFFALFTLITVWMLTLGVVTVTGQALLWHTKPRLYLAIASAVLIFALPKIRNSQPGIPKTPTISDTMGYYWALFLLCVCIFCLMVHSIILPKTETQRNAARPHSVEQSTENAPEKSAKEL